MIKDDQGDSQQKKVLRCIIKEGVSTERREGMQNDTPAMQWGIFVLYKSYVADRLVSRTSEAAISHEAAAGSERTKDEDDK